MCNGVACKNQIPGPGAKGVCDTAIRNYNKWAEIRVNMDTLCENGTPDAGVELFGKTFKYPFFAGPVPLFLIVPIILCNYSIVFLPNTCLLYTS